MASWQAIRAAFRRFQLDQRGQAMVEYSTISLFLLAGTGGIGMITFIPKMLNAMQAYLDSVYYIINLPLP